jgi:hypothetical protein
MIWWYLIVVAKPPLAPKSVVHCCSVQYHGRVTPILQLPLLPAAALTAACSRLMRRRCCIAAAADIESASKSWHAHQLLTIVKRYTPLLLAKFAIQARKCRSYSTLAHCSNSFTRIPVYSVIELCIARYMISQHACAHIAVSAQARTALNIQSHMHCDTCIVICVVLFTWKSRSRCLSSSAWVVNRWPSCLQWNGRPSYRSYTGPS